MVLYIILLGVKLVLKTEAPVLTGDDVILFPLEGAPQSFCDKTDASAALIYFLLACILEAPKSGELDRRMVGRVEGVRPNAVILRGTADTGELLS